MDGIDVSMVVALGALLYSLGAIHGKRRAAREHATMTAHVLSLAARDRDRANAMARRSQ